AAQPSEALSHRYRHDGTTHQPHPLSAAHLTGHRQLSGTPSPVAQFFNCSPVTSIPQVTRGRESPASEPEKPPWPAAPTSTCSHQELRQPPTSRVNIHHSVLSILQGRKYATHAHARTWRIISR
ncbi:hypothetical protein SOVF_212220, partial [Spinacia oleracea]